MLEFLCKEKRLGDVNSVRLKSGKNTARKEDNWSNDFLKK